MINQIKKVLKFREVTNQKTDATPHALEFEKSLELNDRLKGKLRTYNAIHKTGDAAKIAHALGDLTNEVLNLVCEHGMQGYIQEILHEIGESNLSRLGADGEVYFNEDGSIGKGPFYFEPKVSDILKGKKIVRTKWYNFTINKKYKEVTQDVIDYRESVINTLNYKREKFVNNTLKENLKWYDFVLFLVLKNTGMVSLKKYFADKINIVYTSNAVVMSVYGSNYSENFKIPETRRPQPRRAVVSKPVVKEKVIEQVKPEVKKKKPRNNTITQIPSANNKNIADNFIMKSHDL